MHKQTEKLKLDASGFVLGIQRNHQPVIAHLCYYKSLSLVKMSINLSTETIQTTISQLNRDFSGRIGTDGYDESKLLHIHRRNRAYVWNKEMQEDLLDSILMGYYVPPIICCSRFVGNAMGIVERREIMEGGNRMTTIRRILNNEVRELTPQERQKIEAFGISLVVMRNLTSKHQRKMFRRLNKNVKVTDGQLYAMSIEDSPLVKEAEDLLKSDDHPLRSIITHHFFDTRNSDNDGKNDLANAVALVSGAIHGVHNITKSYNIQDPMVDSMEPINRATVVQVLGAVFEVFTLADQVIRVNAKKRRSQWNVGKWLGVMIYDYHMNPGHIRAVQDKWVNYIVRVRKGEEGAEDAAKISGAQNLNVARYCRISNKVDIYVRENRLATDTELNLYRHPVEEEDEDDNSTVSTDTEEM